MALSRTEQIRALNSGGVAGMGNILAFRNGIESQPHVNALSERISADSGISNDTQSQFLTVMAQKWTQDQNKEVFQKLESELAANPSLGDDMIAAMQTNAPAAISAISKYNGSNLNEVVAMTKPGAAASNAPQAPQNAPQAPAPTGATTTATGVPVSPPPSPISGAAATNTPPSDPASDDDVLDAIISSSDKDISAATSADGVKMLADKMASVATTKFGVNPATAEGFKKKIDDPKSMVNGKPLAEAIAQNLKNNPDFVRQMAIMAKDKSTMPEPFKSKAQQEMNKLMEKPELLASDAFVKEKMQQFALAEQMKKMGISGMLNEFMAGAMGPLKSGMNDMGYMFAGFAGYNKVISMSTGSMIFPSLMIDLDAFEANKNAAMAIGRYSPLEMTALAPKGADGKFFHEVVKKGPDGKELLGRDGKPLTESVPNGLITIKTADGKEKKVIPAVGTLVAKQEAGTFDANGQFVAGNFRVPVITDINEHGVSSGKVQIAVMTPVEFEKYKQQADAAAKERGGSIKELEVETYTVADARRAGQNPGPQVVQVNPQSGAVAQPVVLAAGPASFSISTDPNLLNNRGTASNDRDFRLQG